MRILVLACLTAGLPAFGQAAARFAAGLPEDPRAALTAVLPSYDLHHPSLKPWHLKASYQLFGRDGTPAKDGTYEYWWASSQTHRSTWKSAGAVHTDWYTADGSRAHQTIGERPQFLEYKLESALIAPLPDLADLDPARVWLVRDSISVTGGSTLPCIMAIPSHYAHLQKKKAALGVFPSYCFDSILPVLRVSYAPGIVATEFNKIALMQNRYIAREILIFNGTHMILSAKVESITGLDPLDAALTPSRDEPAMARSDLH